MAARTTREQARQRVMAILEQSLEQMIPEDSQQPLRGRTFLEWEDQAQQLTEAVTGAVLEERAALEDSALVEPGELGRCPHCGSDRLYLQRREPKNKTIRTPQGEVVLSHQSLRCRSCDRSFSPSGP